MRLLFELASPLPIFLLPPASPLSSVHWPGRAQLACRCGGLTSGYWSARGDTPVRAEWRDVVYVLVSGVVGCTSMQLDNPVLYHSKVYLNQGWPSRTSEMWRPPPPGASPGSSSSGRNKLTFCSIIVNWGKKKQQKNIF